MSQSAECGVVSSVPCVALRAIACVVATRVIGEKLVN